VLPNCPQRSQAAELLDLYRTVTAAYAGAAAAVAQAAVSGTDPQAAVSAAKPVTLNGDGRPTDLPLLITGLDATDQDIARAHALGTRGHDRPRRSAGRRQYIVEPVDEPAHQLDAYADHLRGLVAGGQLRRLLLRR
jgi:hypothetical protein